ncbi:hypothetical protein ILYODFUR_028705 [Ilyodon furcidens]|uniref:Uncharacterized protein n=1 Tax=Ilyodon furcidens TaxID=33524 RepID=A0ABV0UKV9_9TELE
MYSLIKKSDDIIRSGYVAKEHETLESNIIEDKSTAKDEQLELKTVYLLMGLAFIYEILRSEYCWLKNSFSQYGFPFLQPAPNFYFGSRHSPLFSISVFFV